MKKRRIMGMVLVMLIIIVLSSAFSPISASSNATEKPDETVQKVTEARFLNMLNHNFVYNEAFDCVDDVVNNSVLSLLDLSDDEGFINESYVKDFVSNMYGIEIADMSGLNADYPSRDGFVYVIPRGFSEYKHSVVSCTRNEDGTYLLTTDVEIYSHDDQKPESFKAVTMFVENEASDWGYNIVYSNIIFDSSAI